MGVERTLVLIKPDAVRRGLVGDVLARLERKGLVLRGIEMRVLPVAVAERHYHEHAGKTFFAELVAFITGGPLVAVAVEGDDAIAAVRTLMGPTNPVTAPPGTIRGDLALLIGENLVHGSDSADSAKNELALFFPDLVSQEA